MPKIDKKCGVCKSLLKICKRMGDRSYCKRKIKQLEKDEITDTEFDKQIRNHFGASKFNKEWEEEIENG